ncbi:hypothetical protein SAMN05421772_12230 [Paracoccus saliphilus]|uniref:Uncharacterized protein n=1 Tax=Paracoccus saliphilus TaxID=405559 RepID=A0AA46A7H7_9RHOB|nr:hypothetical protein [Paracoccus saliphilus]SIT12950.1 hypothetical protein SAMN05421772_12230 [Paracoccus saliphilus]
MDDVSIIGLDLAKNVFQAHGAGSDGSVVFRRKLSCALPPVVTEETNVARLTGGITFVGYLVAFALPLLGGLLSDAVDGVGAVFIPTAVLALALASFGHRGDRYQDRIFHGRDDV